jgi:hypothetical protein
MVINMFNHFHKGDLFFSRMQILPLLEMNYKVNFYHNYNKYFFYDFEKEFENFTEITPIPPHISEYSYDDFNNNLINAWIGKGHGYKFILSDCASYETHKNMSTHILKNYSIDSNKKDFEFLPKVFTNHLIFKSHIDEFILQIKKNFKKIILICNGNVESGQSNNFSFDDIIKKISLEHPEFLFLLTQRTDSIFLENVKFVDDIINIYPNILEISYLSIFCDVIVGRASGPYVFSSIYENISNKNKTFISFTHKKCEGSWFEGYEGNQAKWIWSNDYNQENILKTIIDNIK